ncbi:MAG: hypothetical protein FJY98_03695 [Candidatus Liptonbacteria bacterium]|nr:hypothetical protein [Candidatus Liptonbacteria bacterium]
MNSETKQCKSCGSEFIIEPDDFAFYETIHVPPPTWCPQCRLTRRLSWQGYRIFYKRKCDFTGEMLFTTHHPEAPHKMYRQDIWWSDTWDPKSYGRDVDFSRPFLEQFQELLQEVPLPNLYTAYSTLQNSDYCNAASGLKNCYLCFRITGGENNAYLSTILEAKDSLDCSFANSIESCYGSVRINKCYQAFFSDNCDSCHNIWFSKDLSGCSDCIGCINLRSKQYCIFNEQKTKEEYEQFKTQLDLGSSQKVKEFAEKAEVFFLKHPRRNFHGLKNVNVSGDYIFNSKNVRESFMLGNGENLCYCQFLKNGPARNSYDWSFFGDNGEWVYESAWVGLTTSQVRFSAWNYGSRDIEYCFGCMNSGNLFGCVGLRGGTEYCILNKQYSQEEYLKLVDHIKKQMMEVPYRDSMGREYRYGEMLPAEMSPWTYNEATVCEWFPKSKEEATKDGFLWRDPDAREYREATVELPEHIKDIPDTITKEILKCVSCGKNYQIIPMELQFLKRFGLPVPRECPLCRDRARIKQLNPIHIYDRTCAKCGAAMQTSYAPERPEIVYCEACYQKEVL